MTLLRPSQPPSPPPPPGSSGGSPRPAAMESRLRDLQARHGDLVPLAEVGGIVANLLQSIRGDVSSTDLRLYGELEALARYIERAKQEISSVRCDDIPAKHIPLASGELDAIGTHLEDATGVILDACEELEAVGRRAGGETEATIAEVVTRIYEACSFQDITGQRITKVISTLRTIEERIGRLLVVLGDELSGGRSGRPAEAGTRPSPASSRDSGLLNGPQSPGSANSQADIDALLAGFA